MKKNQSSTENEINAPVSLNQTSDEPKSAHSTPVVEKYVEKRKEKAEKQVEKEPKAESKSSWDWASIKYVIL
jgi:hypothetical protein